MNPILAQQTVIVYRSKTEQMQDEAAQRFMAEHPDAILNGFYIFFGLVAAIILFNVVNFFRIRRLHSRFRFRR